MRLIAGTVLIAVLAGPAAAAVDAYLRIEGFPGSSATHSGWMEASRFQWGVGRGITSPAGASADRESGAPSVSEITISRQIDKASPMLKACAATDCRLGRVELMTRKAGGAQPFQHYVLSNAMISGYSVSSGGDRPSESIRLNFTKIETGTPRGPRQTLPMKEARPGAHP